MDGPDTSPSKAGGLWFGVEATGKKGWGLNVFTLLQQTLPLRLLINSLVDSRQCFPSFAD